MSRRYATPEEHAQSPEAVLLKAAEDRDEERLEEFAMDAIARLPRRARLVAVQRFVKGKTQEEAADALGTSRFRVREAEDDARERLLTAIGNAGVV